MTLPGSRVYLTEAYPKARKTQEGLAVTKALVVDETGHRTWEAELYRLKGELPVMRG